MRRLFKAFTGSLIVSAGSVAGTLLALNVIADLSNPVKKRKIKDELKAIKNRISNK